MKTTTLFGILFLTASTACQHALAAPIGNTAVQSSADPRANAIIVPTQSQEDDEADLADLDDAASNLSDEDEDDEDEDDSKTDDELDRRGAVRSMLPKAGLAALSPLKSSGKSKRLPHSKGSQQGSHKALTKSAGRSPSTRKVKPQILGGARGFRGAQTHARKEVGSRTGAAKKFRPAFDSRGPLSGKTRAPKGSRSAPLAGKLARIPRASRMPKQRGGSWAPRIRSPSTTVTRSGPLQRKTSDSRAKHFAGCKRSDVVCNMGGSSTTRLPHAALNMEPLGPSANKGEGKLDHRPAGSSTASLTSVPSQDHHVSLASPQGAHAQQKSWFSSLYPFRSSAKKNEPILPLTHELPQVPTGPVSEDDARRMTAHNDAVNTRINLHNSHVQTDTAIDQKRNRWCETGIKACALAGVAFTGYKFLHGRSLQPQALDFEKRTFTDAYYVADR